MHRVAIKMLLGDRAKYLGIVMGLTFASLLITQQAGIFVGLMTRTYGFVSDTSQPDIWVCDPKIQFIDDLRQIPDAALNQIRGTPGVEWAVPMFKGFMLAHKSDGSFLTCNVIGLDDGTLMGGPPEMLEGSLADLRKEDGVIVDIFGAEGKLAKPSPVPGEPPIPLKVGDSFELNDRRAVVVGICRVGRTFQSQPVFYTTFSRAATFAGMPRATSFVLVKAAPGESIPTLCERLQQSTGLAAFTNDQFKALTVNYYLTRTAIPINFGIAVALGFVVGLAIAGQTFYNFTLDNLRHFAALKAMGAENHVLLWMIIAQSAMVGLIGYGMGVGIASLMGYLLEGTELSFKLPWQLLLISFLFVMTISLASAVFSIRRVLKCEPAIVFRS